MQLALACTSASQHTTPCCHPTGLPPANACPYVIPLHVAVVRLWMLYTAWLLHPHDCLHGGGVRLPRRHGARVLGPPEHLTP
jgi:hypothetical protein